MRDYKGYTPKERMANLARVKKAIKEGTLPNPNTLPCEICGQTEGIREYHCKDYNPEVAMQSLQCLCYKCHRALHVYELGETHRWYKRAVEYFDEVKRGVKHAPVMSYYKKR